MSQEWSQASTTDGQTFVFASEGDGPLVVLLHGFPDTPHGGERIAAALAGAGYRAVRPWLRGYHPDTHVPGRPYDAISIAEDAVRLLDALGESSAVLVGHDWGAAIAYDAASLHPERFRAIVPIAIPHPSLLPRTPAAAWAARHFLVHRLLWAERTVRRRDFAYLEKLYRRWAPSWTGPERDDCLERAKRCFADPGSLSGALAYYRALSLKLPPEIAEPPAVRGLVVGGTDEIVDPGLFEKTAARLADGSESLLIEGARHWPHRESEDAFIEALLGFVSP